MSQRLRTSQAIHEEYDWNKVVDLWRPLIERLADEAPPLDERFVVGGVPAPSALRDDVSDFVDAVNEGLAQDKPKKRVAPLVSRVAA